MNRLLYWHDEIVHTTVNKLPCTEYLYAFGSLKINSAPVDTCSIDFLMEHPNSACFRLSLSLGPTALARGDVSENLCVDLSCLSRALSIDKSKWNGIEPSFGVFCSRAD